MSARLRWGFDRKAGAAKRPVPLVRAYRGPYPILAHRTMAEVMQDEAEQLQAVPPKKKAGPRIKSGVTVKEYPASAGVDVQGGQVCEPCAEPASRPAAGRSAAATSEAMDVTAGETATELPERLDGFASVQDGLCQMSTNGALLAGTETPAARTPALRGVTAGETAPVSDPISDPAEATPPKQASAPVPGMAALPLAVSTHPASACAHTRFFAAATSRASRFPRGSL